MSRIYQVGAHLLVIAITVLVLVWLLHIREGLSLQSDPIKIFNVHALVMIIGFILIGGEAMMAYKTIPSKRRRQKAVHAILHILALGSGAFGVYVGFRFDEKAGLNHMFTLHSWLGIVTISLYGLQYVLAFFAYVFPGVEMRSRVSYLSWHTFGGLFIFLLGICTAETGLVQKFYVLGLNGNQEKLVVNFIGLLLILFGVSVGLTVVVPPPF